MRKFTKLFCTAFLLLAGGVSASAQNAEEVEGEKVYATFASPTGITWDADNKTFSWTSQYGNQLHNIGLPNGNLSEYVQLVVDCEVQEGTGYRFMFYSTEHGTTAGGTTIILKEDTQAPNSSKKVYNLADFNMDKDYLTKCSEICLSGYDPSGTVKVNEVYLIKSIDPLAGFKKQLTDAITAAESRNSYAKTEASWKALTEALAAGKTALEAADATQESLEAAATAIYDAIDGLKLTKGYSNLSTNLFHVWTGPGADATITDDAVYPANEVGNSIGQGVTVWGDPSVRYVQYADLSEYKQLVILGTPGFTARLCLNRQEPVEGGDANGSAYIEIIEDLNEDGVLVIDLENHDKLKDATYIHLNSFKTPWNGKTGTFSEVLLYHEPVVTPIELTLAEGDIAAAVAAAQADIENAGDYIGDITINLAGGVIYTISSSISAGGSIKIASDGGAVIDASSLNAPFIALPNEDVTEWTIISNVTIADVTIKGLKKALVASAKKNYAIEDFMVIGSVVEVAGDATTFDFTKGSVVQNFNITNSTFYAPKATEKAFYSSQSGQKLTEWENSKQCFIFSNSTFYNLAKGKNFFSHRQSNQAWMEYDVQNNIFVNCGKSGQTIKGMNGGQGGANPTWTIIGNAFNFDGADTSAAESTGDDNEPVQNSVVGVVTFTDAANGDFNGTFELAEGAQTPEALGDSRWTINFKEYVAPVVHTWDFTAWSEATVTNLKAEAAKGYTEGLWSDAEKADGTAATMEISKDNCFWQVGTSAAGGEELTANGESIAELKGLIFKNNKARSLAIAVNYGDCTSANGEGFGPYNGPAYLWLGSKNIEYFTIPAVKGGTTITMGVESHKFTEARGVQLLVNGEALNDPEGNAVAAPTTYTEQTWQVPAGSPVNVVVKNTNGCHIYFIDAEIDETTDGIETIQQNTVNNDAIYNLNGQRVMNAQKGLYIINGKKVIVK